MQTNNYLFAHWDEGNFRAVNKFYRSQQHKGSASGDEQVFVIRNQTPDNNDIVGAVRLVPYDGFYWLRSLYIKQELRGQSLGLGLLNYVHEAIHLPIHCFPYPHLDHFYGLAGYSVTPLDEIPLPLQQLYSRYAGKGEPLLIMSYSPN
jgi:hypothetical protein